MGPKVAVLIPTLNEEKTLDQLLDSLNQNTYPNKEIVIIDGGSKDRTLEIARKAGATVIEETGEKAKRCPANAWNQGAGAVDADIVGFLDADSIGVNRGFIGNAAAAFDSDTAAVYASYKTVKETLTEKIIGEREGISIHPTFVRKDIFIDVGGYPLIGYGEDTLFAGAVRKRAAEMGLKEKEIRDSYWTGHPASSIRELYKQKRWYGRTSVHYLRRLKGKERLRGAIGVYTMPIYFLSTASALLAPISQMFIFTALPALAIFILTLARNRGWGRLKVLLNIITGIAMLHGLFVWAVSSNARTGR